MQIKGTQFAQYRLSLPLTSVYMTLVFLLSPINLFQKDYKNCFDNNPNLIFDVLIEIDDLICDFYSPTKYLVINSNCTIFEKFT